MTNRTFAIDEELNRQAADILDSIGMNMNAYVRLSLKQLVNERRVPFDLKAETDIPNELTWRRMIEAEAKELGLLPDDATTYDDPEQAIAALHKAAEESNH